jgi:hypothetical protein
MLFEVGAYAILDGYYREAVSSFTTSLERFHEFAIRVFLDNTSKASDLFQNCWKHVSSQTERQLGAFIFLWASNFGQAPVLLDSKQVKFRNEVIHKGVIPSREQAVNYGDGGLAILRPQMLALKERFPKEVQSVTLSHIQECRSGLGSGQKVTTMWVLTIVSLVMEDASHHQKSLEEHLLRLALSRQAEASSQIFSKTTAVP